jgi:hypothetical protein
MMAADGGTPARGCPRSVVADASPREEAAEEVPKLLASPRHALRLHGVSGAWRSDSSDHWQSRRRRSSEHLPLQWGSMTRWMTGQVLLDEPGVFDMCDHVSPPRAGQVLMSRSTTRGECRLYVELQALITCSLTARSGSVSHSPVTWPLSSRPPAARVPFRGG